MIKLLIFIPFLLSIISGSSIAHAGASKRAFSVPGYPYEEDQNFSYDQQAYVTLDENTIIYTHHSYPRLNNEEPRGKVYAYDINSRTSTLLYETVLEFDETPRQAGAPTTAILKSNGNVFVSINGKLIRTKGEPNSTNFLGDYGSYICCFGLASSYPRARLLMADAGIVYFELTEDVGPGGAQVPTPSRVRLWRSDGTKRGTYPISRSHLGGEGIHSPFVLNEGGTRVVYYLFGSKLWKVNGTPEQAASIVFHQFEREYPFFGIWGRVPAESTGTFAVFCRGREEESYLWKISNRGELSVIDQGCSNSNFRLPGKGSLGKAFIRTEDSVYYNTKSSFKRYRFSEESLETLSVGPVNDRGYCFIGKQNYFAMRDSILQVSRGGQVKKITLPENFRPDGVSLFLSVSGCTDNGLLLSLSDNYHVLLNPETGEFNRVTRFSQHTGFPTNVTSIAPNGALLVEGNRAVFYISSSIGFLPNVIEILLSD